MTERTFILTADSSTIEPEMIGLAYSGTDLVLSSGYGAFQAETGRSLTIGNDGAYILVQPTETGARIGTDFSGYGKLFLYRHGTYWAVSNSFYELVRFLHADKYPLTLDLAQLASFFLPYYFGEQLKSSKTLMREIRFVPAHCHLEITPGGIKERLHGGIAAPAELPSRYEPALQGALKTWLGRFATLLKHQPKVICDLSGGLDSRTAMALVMAAGRLVGDPALSGVHINSNSSRTKDYEVATGLMRDFGLSNEGKVNPFTDMRRSTQEGYALWKTLYLGCYNLNFFPSGARRSDTFWISGDGGESTSIRAYDDSGEGSLAEYLGRVRDYIPDPLLADRFIATTVRETDALAREDGSGIHERILQFQAFRERFHGGRRSTYLNSITPLAGREFKHLTRIAGQKRVEDSQILYDIMANTVPGMVLPPFELETRRFGQEVLDGCTRLPDFSHEVDLAGKVYADRSQDSPTGSFDEPVAMQMMMTELEEHLDFARQTGVFPESYIDEARAIMRRSTEIGEFKAAKDGDKPAHVLFGGVMRKYATRAI